MPLPRPQAPAMPELPYVTLSVDALRGRVVGRLLADRALSRLLRDDWPRSIDEW